MPENKQFIVNIGDQREIWDSDMFAEKGDALFAKYKDAEVFEVEDIDSFDEDPTNYQYIINLGDQSELWDADMVRAKGAKLMEAYPDVKIQRVSYKDYWGERATANREQRAALLLPDADRNARLAELGYYDDLSENQLEFGMDTNLGFGLKPLSSAIETSVVTGQTKYLDPAVQEFFAKDSANTERMAEIARLDAEYESNPAVIAQREWEAQQRADQAKYIDTQLAAVREDMDSEVDAYHAVQGAQAKHGYDPYGASMTVQAIRMIQGEDVGKDMVENEKMETYQSAIKLYEMAKQANEIAGKGFWGAVGDVAMDKLRNLATQSDIEMYNEIGDILTRLESQYGSLENLTDEQIESGLSKAEQALIHGFFAYNEAMEAAGQDMSRAYKGGKIFGESVGFMLEFLATGGLAGGTGKAASSGVGRALVKWASKAAKGTAKRAFRTGTTKALRGLSSAAVGTLARTVAAPGTYRNMAEQSVKIEDGHLDRTKNATKAFFDSYIENLSEISGGVIGKSLGMFGLNPSKLLGKVSFGKIGQLLADNRLAQGLSKSVKALFGEQGALTKLGFNGIFEEVEEEYIGSFIREVTGVQPGALAEMHKDGNFGAMLIGFAPMTLFGAGMSAANMAATNIEAANLGKKLRETLGQHYTDDAVSHMMSLVDNAENADDVWKAIEPMAGALNEEETTMLYQYGAFKAQNKTMFFARKAQERQLADAKRAEIQQEYGKFWQEGEDGAQSVQMADLNDGRRVFVLSAANEQGEIAVVDTRTGETSIANVADIKSAEQDGVTSPQTRTWSMDAFLDYTIALDRRSAEQTRMVNERDQQIEALKSGITEGMEINLGTEGSPVIMLATGHFTKDGVLAGDASGNIHTIGWVQAADALGTPIRVKTDQDLIDEETAAIAARRAERRKKAGSASQQLRAALDETAQQTAEVVSLEERHIPKNPDGSVNEAAFWEQDPEGYAQWNDEQNKDGGADTMRQLAVSKMLLAGVLAEAQKATQTSNPAERKAAEQAVREIQDKIDRYTAIEQSYVEKAIAPLRERAMKWNSLTGASVILVENEDQLAEISGEAARQSAGGARVRGFAKDGRAYIYLPGVQDAAEIDAVFVHEAVSHQGLKGLLGQKGFEELCEQVWQMMSPEMQNVFINYPGVNGKRLAAADEYIAHIAERIGTGVADETERTIWEKIVDFVRNILRAMGIEVGMNERELSDLLHMAYADLAKNLSEAEKIAQQNAERKEAVGAAPTTARQMYDAYIQEGLTPEEVSQGVQNDFKAAKEAYDAKVAEKPTIKAGESTASFIERKKTYNEELGGLEQELRLQQALMDEIARIQNTAMETAVEEVPVAEEVLEDNGIGVEAIGLDESAAAGEGVRFSTIREVNDRFNAELQQQIDGTLPVGHVYQLGMPSRILRSTGIPGLPITLQSSILNIKSNDALHSYDLSEVKDLVKAIQKPWAIFKYGDSQKAQNLIVGIAKGDKQFLIGISLNPTVKGKTLNINSVRNVFPKDNDEWLNWIQEGKLLRVDEKEKIQAIIDALRINPVDYTHLDLDSIANIVENFENPSSEDARFSVITPEMDAEYLAAVERGDIETAQRMVLEAAKLAMPNTKVVDENGAPKVVYHGSPNVFYKFGSDSSVKRPHTAKDTHFFVDDMEVAQSYGKELYPVFLNLANPIVKDFEGNSWNQYAEPITPEELKEWEEERKARKERIKDLQEKIEILKTDYEASIDENDIFRIGDSVILQEIHELENELNIATILDKAFSTPPTHTYSTTDKIVAGAKNTSDGAIFKNVTDAASPELTHKIVTDYVAYSPSQIKSADPVTYDDNGNVIPLSERFNPEKSDIRFSTVRIDPNANQQAEGNVMFSTRRGSLVGMHNISEEKLSKVIKRGGSANPSTAVIDIERQAFDSYGEISLIMPSSLVDAETGRNAGTFTADAWTPTYPQIEKRFSVDELQRAYWRDITAIPEEMQHEVRMAFDSWLDNRTASGLAYMFLQERGEAPEMVRVAAKFPQEIKDKMSAILGEGRTGIYELTDEEKQAVLDLYIQENFGGSREDFDRSIAETIQRIEDRLSTGKVPSFVEKRITADLQWMKEHGYDYDELSKFVSAITADIRHAGEVNDAATTNRALDYIKDNGLEKEFDRWKESLNDRYGIKEYLFDGYTPSGNPRWLPNTVENASKLMNKQGLAGATGMTSSFNRFVATLAPKKKSLSDIRSSKDLLVEDENLVDDFRDKWSEVFFDLGIKCQPDAKGYEDYGLERLTEAAQKKNPGAYLKKEYGVELSQEDLQRLADMIKAIKTEFPARYFETKFQRPVYLNEFAAAVIPTTTSADIKQAIAEAGLPIFEYDSSADGARREATLKATDIEGVRFSVFEPHNATMDEIDGLFHDYNGDKSLEPLYDKVSALAHTMGLQIRFDYPWSEAAGSTFGDKVKFNTEFFNSLAYMPQDKAHALLHEMIHAVTQYAIFAKNTKALTPGMKEAVKQLEDVYEEIKTDRLFAGTYGAKSVHEMIAELSNPAFRNLLKVKSLYQRIVDAIKRLLGIEVGDNALDNVSATLDYMIDNYDGTVFNAVVNALGQNESYIRFSVANENQAIFVSNAARAVEAIKMEKATPAQWLAMIEKAGGLKVGEDKWMGLSDWLKASKAKTLTKAEVLDFINENMIIIEEEKYGEVGLSALQEEFDAIYDNIIDNVGNEDESNLQLWEVAMNPMERAWEELRDRYYGGDDFDMAFSYDSHGNIEVNDPDAVGYFLGIKPINNTRLDYTTSGLTNLHEIALTVPTIEPWNETDDVHFGDAGEGRAVAWIRFGETTDESGNRILVIDEIQSNRHQEGRENGYRDDAKIAELKERENALLDEKVELTKEILHKFGVIHYSEKEGKFDPELQDKAEQGKIGSPEQMARIKEIDSEIISIIDELSKLYKAIPDAPFEKNWHELAMKRMLRYAAEEGYDVIAWTKGEQQAERYNIGTVVEKIILPGGWIENNSDKLNGKKVRPIYVVSKNMYDFSLSVNEEGVVVDGSYTGQNLSDVVGKEMAVKLMTAEPGTSLEGDELRIGGEGMKGFYDKMLPAFMNKYGKKWGVKVEDITLPNVEEAGRVMHSVPVTEEMKASVMEGQVMFSAVQIDPAVRQEMDTIKAKAMWDGTFMKAPNGADTKLTEDQWLMVRTNNFKNWFGDWINDPENASKVVDPETREPRVMYHGSAWHPLTEPKGNAVFRMRSGLLGRGAYFASSIEEATLYAEMATDIDVAIEGNYEILQDEYVTDYFLNIRNTEDIGDFGRGDIIAVAKSPSQIKSATETTGLFSENEDIRFSAFRPVGGNSGYVGYSMSKRAASARAEGRFPKTDFRKEYGVTSASLDLLVHCDIISGSEWHHTSMYGNKTHFYGWHEEEYADIYTANKKEIDALAREYKKSFEAYRNSGKELHERLVAGEITPQEVYELGKEMDGIHWKKVAEIQARIDAIFNPTDNGGGEESAEEDVLFSAVTDPMLVAQFESEPKVKVYRAMQLIDGKLYPPMSAYVDGVLCEPSELGQWEQAEENTIGRNKKDPSKVDLEQGKGDDGKKRKTSGVLYNPYFHTSLTPLNDQFSGAQTRSNLVIVETEVPQSELTSGYQAEGAANSVGMVDWHSGPIAGVLAQYEGKGRQVILSRWAKPIRIVPESEIADIAMKLFEGTTLMDVPLPSNVFTPALREELERRGMKFVETTNNGRLVSDRRRTWSKTYGKNGLAKRPTEDIRFSIAERPVDEIVNDGKMMVARGAEAAKTALLDRMKNIDKSLEMAARMIASAQREYDRATVKIITDAAQSLLKEGALSKATNYEVSRLLSAVKNATGRKDLTKAVNTLIDIMVANQLRHSREMFRQMLKIKATRVNASGVEAQGRLDLVGQKVVAMVKEAIEMDLSQLEERIGETEDRISSGSETVRSNAEIDLVGLKIAKQYLEGVKASEAEEILLRDELKRAGEDHAAGSMTDEAYREFVKSTEDAVRQNRIERTKEYRNILHMMAETIAESFTGAKNFRDAEKARIERIHHFANSDLQGKTAEAHEQKVKEFWNAPLVRLVMAPLATFEQWMRVFGQKSAEGKGYLYNHFVGGWNDATNAEYLGIKAAHEILDAKVQEVFAGVAKRWSDLFSIDKKMPTATISMWDDGQMRDYEVTQGNLLYVYMVNKMTDGKMKLRKMGITEADVDAIVRHMDPRFLELADWIQDEFLPGLRDKYNAVHERLFGAPMAAIDSYFPIRVLANARVRDIELGADTEGSRPSSITGSIIKRTKNSLALDVLGSNAFDVVLEHIEQMEHWAAFAEFNRDLNTLLSYRTFRNRVQNMSTAFGSGREAWNSFKETAEIVAGVYKPKTSKVDKALTNAVKGLTAGKISLRLWTAMKQVLSMPAFLPYVNPAHFVKNFATPWIAWNWAMDELPAFEKRWRSREAGNVRLKKTDADWKLWSSKIMEIATRIGMTPNAAVDAFTCAIGAKSVYDTMYARYTKDGYSHEMADKKAKLDATVAFNATQQSSESAFVSAIQSDRTFVAHMATVFRNNSFGMGREFVDALRNMRDRTLPGYKEMSIEFMRKQMVREGVSEEDAVRAAERIYRNTLFKDAARIATFGFMMQFLWNLGNNALYLMFGDDDDEKKEMVKDALIKGAFGSAEGLAFGNVVPELASAVASDKLKNFSISTAPAVSDVKSLWKELNTDFVAGASDLVNIIGQMAIGMNPQTIVDVALAIYDACEGNLDTSKEVAIALLRIVNAPQSNIDKLIMDEIDFTIDEGLDMTIDEFARRYARYKKSRNAPYTEWAYSDEAARKAEEKYIKRFRKDAEALKRTRGNENAQEFYEYYDNGYKETSETLRDLRKRLQEEDSQENRDAMEQFQLGYPFFELNVLSSDIRAFEAARKAMKDADTPEDRSLYESLMYEARDRMVKTQRMLEFLEPYQRRVFYMQEVQNDLRDRMKEDPENEELQKTFDANEERLQRAKEDLEMKRALWQSREDAGSSE